MRTITFPTIRGRSYAYNSLVRMLTPGARGDEYAAATPTASAAGAQPDTFSAPASRTRKGGESASPGRAFLGRTEDRLNDGPAPDRINRDNPARNAGDILPGIGNRDGMAGWPYDGNALMIPHQRIPRTPITVTAFARTIDNSVTIPSIGVGNPVG